MRKLSLLLLPLAGLCLILSDPGAAHAGIPRWVEYHDYTSYDHGAELQSLKAKGFRPISLSVYGDVGNARYAAVLIKRPGPDWVEFHGLSLAGFQSVFDTEAAKGFKVTLLAATGSSSHPSFAAVWEKAANGVIPITRSALRKAGGSLSAQSQDTIDYWLDLARRRGNDKIPSVKGRKVELIPSTIAAYGTAEDPRFALVLEPNPERVGWNADPVLETSSGYQQRFDALVRGFHRPATVAMSQDGRYWGLFRDDMPGRWKARHNLDRAGLDAAIKTMKAKGYLPLSVQGGGASGHVRYNVLFATSVTPEPRVFTVKGHGVAPAVDGVIENFMRANGLHQAGLAVVLKHKLVLARGYTYARKGFPLATPTTYFRTASCAKTITALAIEQLIQEGVGHITPDAPVESILKWKTRSGKAPADPHFAGMTIRQLLTHTSGLLGYTPSKIQGADAFTPNPRQMADAIGATLPLTAADVQEYFVTRPHLINPSEIGKFHYANVGYYLLARVVEKLRGVPYIAAIRQYLGAKLGATRVRLLAELIENQAPDEARYFDANSAVGDSFFSAGKTIVAVPYGADETHYYDGAGAISITPVDLAKILSVLDVTYENPVFTPAGIADIFSGRFGFDSVSGAKGSWHGVKGGLISGLQSMNYVTQNGLTYVVFWDRNEVNRGVDRWYPSFPELQNAILSTHFPATDWFPSYGIPSFPVKTHLMVSHPAAGTLHPQFSPTLTRPRPVPPPLKRIPSVR